jgi:hypothetical protein
LRAKEIAGPDRALIVAQRVATGGGIERLGTHLMYFGVQPDYGVVCNQIGETAGKIVGDTWPSSNIYVGGMSDVHSSEVSRALGFQTRSAAPVPSSHEDTPPHVLEATKRLVADTVTEYMDSRLPSITP